MMQHAPMIILQLSMILPIQPMTSYPLWSLQMHAAAGVLKAGTPSGKQPKLPCGLCARLDSKLWASISFKVPYMLQYAQAQLYVLAKIASEVLMVVEEMKAWCW